MNEFELNLRLKQEMESMAPNRLDDLLAACKDVPVKPNIEPIAPHRSRRIPRLIAAAAAVVLLSVGSFCGVKGAQRSVVMMEVNPSVSFTVNGFGRVRGVSLNNADAQALFESAKLKGLSLEDAVEFVSDVLIDREILTAESNGVLVSVSNAGERRAASIGDEVVGALDDVAEEFGFRPAVVLLRTDGDQAGTEVLRKAVISRVAGLPAEKAGALGVQELFYVMQSQNIPLDQMEYSGTLQGWACASGRDAERIAAEDASFTGAEDSFITLLSTYADQLAYQISFRTDDGWLTYWISAATGDILSRPEAAETEAPTIVPVTPGSNSYSPEQGSTPADVPEPAPTQKPEHGFDSFRDFIDFIDDLI